MKEIESFIDSINAISYGRRSYELCHALEKNDSSKSFSAPSALG